MRSGPARCLLEPADQRPEGPVTAGRTTGRRCSVLAVPGVPGRGGMTGTDPPAFCPACGTVPVREPARRNQADPRNQERRSMTTESFVQLPGSERTELAGITAAGALDPA